MLLLGSDVHLAGNTNGGFTNFLAVLPTADHLIPFDLAKVLAEYDDVVGLRHSTMRENSMIFDVRSIHKSAKTLQSKSDIGKGGFASAAEPSPLMPTPEKI